MPVLKAQILDETTAKAADSSRLRMNYNLHESFEDTVQRMFNALEPGTAVPIARHLYSSETLIMLRGKLRVLIFDGKKNVLENVVLDANTENIGYHIPKGTWHQVESLEHGTICFETREGPYKPVADEDLLK